MKRWIGIALLMIVVVACEEVPGAGPPTITRQASLAPSATILPFASPQPSEAAIGRSNPTDAALAAEGEPSQESDLAILPTQASIPLIVSAPDGALLGAAYYGAVVQSAPTLLLLHGESGDLNRLIALATTLQASGYNIMLLSWRGYGDSDGPQNWEIASSDIQAAFETLDSLALSPQWGIVAEGRAVSAALLACTTESSCQVVVALDPLPDPLLSLGSGATPLLLLTTQEQPTGQSMAQSIASQWPNSLLMPIYTSISAQWNEVQGAIVTWLSGLLPTTIN